MKRSTKAALFSALVLPGLGHLYLKKYLIGVALSLISIAVLYLLVAHILQLALDISEMIVSGQIALNTTSIQSALDTSTSPEQQRKYGLLAYGFLALWIGGAIDAYRQGREGQLSSTDVDR